MIISAKSASTQQHGTKQLLQMAQSLCTMIIKRERGVIVLTSAMEEWCCGVTRRALQVTSPLISCKIRFVYVSIHFAQLITNYINAVIDEATIYGKDICTFTPSSAPTSLPTRVPTPAPTSAPTFSFYVTASNSLVSYDLTNVVTTFPATSTYTQRTFSYTDTYKSYLRFPVSGYESTDGLDGYSWTGDYFTYVDGVGSIRIGSYSGEWHEKVLSDGTVALVTNFTSGDNFNCPNDDPREAMVTLRCNSGGLPNDFSYSASEPTSCRCEYAE